MPALPWRDLLEELISHRTISSDDPALDCSNRPAVEALADRLEDVGFDCRITPLDEREDKVNLIARLGDPTDEDRPQGLAFAGHIDTVPYDADGWDSDPFKLTERDARLHGLGTTDMKGFIALAAGVAGDYAQQKLAAPLSLVISADEECGMDGAQALSRQTAPARFCVIGEPTGLVPIRRHKGIFMERIETRGAAGHSSNPAHGANAIEAMYRVIGAIRSLRDELVQRERVDGFPVPHATLNLGAIRGGDAPNRIPALCKLDVDLRFLPGMRIEDLRAELRLRVETAMVDSDCSVHFQALFDGSPAFETAAESPIITAATQLSGHDARSVDFGTEGAYYNAMGMDTVVLGPGDIALAHQPNEYLALDRIAPMQKILHGLVERFCLNPV